MAPKQTLTTLRDAVLPAPAGALRIAVVGHTNAGKTSLLRTLTRQRHFGTISDNPGTTRHTEATVLRLGDGAAVQFLDTPGLEDSVALLQFLSGLPGESRTARVRAFLDGPEARGTFEQEAKVLRALVERADAAMLVIDTRAPVLPKYRAEIDILTGCARPIMPVLNFVRDPASRRNAWHEALLESNLHARVEFDAVAPFHGAETQLYRDLGALLPEHRAQLHAITTALAQQAHERRGAAARAIADALVDVAAMRRLVPTDTPPEALEHFRIDVAAHARRAVDQLLAIHGFDRDDAELGDLPALAGRWDVDLFNPELLKGVSRRLGTGAMIGAGLGAVADVALAGLSLGAATAAGAAAGGALSGGWQPLWDKLENFVRGKRELTVEDAVLQLLAARLCALARALTARGHAAQGRLQLAAGKRDPADIAQALRALPSARAHPEWEHGAHHFRDSGTRAEVRDTVAHGLDALLQPDTATPRGSVTDSAP